MKYACVTTNLLDMWGQPRFASERVSQLLFGEVLAVDSERRGYSRVRQTDGYAGWVNTQFLGPIAKRQFIEYQRRLNAVVAAEKATICTSDFKTAAPHFLFHGTPLWVFSWRREYVSCYFPDKSIIRLKPRQIRPIKGRKSRKVTRAALVAEAKKFLGVPYLWGGISSAGFDCSGLVRTVFGSFGIYVPRDTKDQIRYGAEIDREDVRAGDLFFFKRHVGLALSRDRIIHSSAGGGGVRINSLTAGTENYRTDLRRDFVTARRIL